MKFVVNNQVVLSQEPKVPIKEYIDSFAKFVSEQGYALSSISEKVHLVACFSRWLKHEGIELHSITSEHPEQYLRYRLQQVKPRQDDAFTLNHLIGFLRSNDVIPAEKISVSQLEPAEYCVQAYEKYLREDRSLAEATILNYVPFIRRFIQDCFIGGTVKLSQLCSRDVVKFVQCQARHIHMKRAKLMTSALRSFLSYARYHGDKGEIWIIDSKRLNMY